MEIHDARSILDSLGLTHAKAINFISDSGPMTLICDLDHETCVHCQNNPSGGVYFRENIAKIFTREKFNQCIDCPRNQPPQQ